MCQVHPFTVKADNKQTKTKRMSRWKKELVGQQTCVSVTGLVIISRMLTVCYFTFFTGAFGTNSGASGFSLEAWDICHRQNTVYRKVRTGGLSRLKWKVKPQLQQHGTVFFLSVFLGLLLLPCFQPVVSCWSHFLVFKASWRLIYLDCWCFTTGTCTLSTRCENTNLLTSSVYFIHLLFVLSAILNSLILEVKQERCRQWLYTLPPVLVLSIMWASLTSYILAWFNLFSVQFLCTA